MAESNFDFTNFFDMLDQHFNEQIQNVNYDKTILCTITNADNADDGEYTVSDGSSHFIAYSTSKYKVKDNVYVLIPEGNYNAAKQIVGKYSSSDSESVTYVAPFENYFDITGNLMPDIAEVGLLANDTDADEAEGYTDIIVNNITARIYNEEFRGNTLYHYLGSYDLDANRSSGFQYLGLKGDFRSYVSQAITGDYGIELVITYLTEDDTIEYAKVRLNSTDMWGNPYNFGSAFTQQQVFDISNYKAVTQISAWFYESANFYSTVNNKITHTKDVMTGTDENGNQIISQEKLPDNLFLSNFYVSLGYQSDGAEKVTLYTRDTTTYSAKKTNDENAKTLRLRWTHILPDTSKTCVALTNYGTDATSESSVLKYITNYEGDGRTVKIHWYMYDKDSTDDLGGTYWKELFLDDSQTPINDFVYKLNLTTDFINTHSNLYFKIIVELIDEAGVEEADATYKDALAQLQVQLTQAKLTLIEYQDEKSVIEAQRNNLKDDNFGVYDTQLMEINTKISAQNEEIEAIQKKVNKLSVNYTSYYTYLKSAILEFTNETDTQSTGTVDYVSGTNIQVIKKDTTGKEVTDTGVYRIYDTLTNDLINGTDEYTYRTLRMSFTSLMAKNSNSGDISQIKWYIPKNNTMIAAPEFGKTYNTENTGETISEENGYYVITRTNADVINATQGDTASTVYGTTDQLFRIKRHLLQSNINNTVKCEILRNGVTYSAEKTLEFANSGSNGTNNTLILKLDKEYVANGRYKAYASYDQLVKEASAAAKEDFQAVGKDIPYDKTVTYYYLDDQGVYRPYLYSSDSNWKAFLEANKVYTNGQAYIAKTNTNKWELPSKTIQRANKQTLWEQTVPTGKDITISYVSADVDCCDKNYENYVAPTVVLNYTDKNGKSQSITIQNYSNVAGTTWGVWPSSSEQGTTITAKGGTKLELVSMGDSNNGRRWTYLYDGGCVIYSYVDLEANTDYTYKIYKYNGKDFIDTGRAYTDNVNWTNGSTDSALVELMSSPPAWTGGKSEKENGADHYITLSAELYNTSDTQVEVDDSKVVWSFFDQNDKGDINPGGFALNAVTTKETNDKGVEVSKVEWRLYKYNNVHAGCILQCTVNVGEKVDGEYATKYTGYLPVAWRSSYDVEFSGADRIIYGTDGATPTYYREAYTLNNKTPSIKRYYQTSETVTDITSIARSQYFWLPTTTAVGLLSPASMFFNDEQYNFWVDLTSEGYEWAQPILVIQNSWGSSLLNSWNGEIATDETTGTILATMVGAGSKNASNQFNGVLMGNVAKGSGDTASGYGVYGYKDGVQAYGLVTDGTAFLGKSGKAQLKFDGNTGRIENSTYNEGLGMRLDFDGSDDNGSSIDMKFKGTKDEVRKITTKTRKSDKKEVICYADDESDDPTAVTFSSDTVYYSNSLCTEVVTVPLTQNTWSSYTGTNNDHKVWGYGKIKNNSTTYNSNYTYYTDADCTVRASTDLIESIYHQNPTNYYYIFKGKSPDPFVTGRTYYSDPELKTVAQVAINAENYSAGNYWIIGKGLAYEYKVNQVYYEDEECTKVASGVLNKENWGKDKDGNTVNAYYIIQGSRVLPDTKFDVNATYYIDVDCSIVATTDLTEDTATEGTTYYWLGLKEIYSASSVFDSNITYRTSDESVAQGRITYDTYEPNRYYYIGQKTTTSYDAITSDTAWNPNTVYYIKASDGTYRVQKFATQDAFESALSETTIYIAITKTENVGILDTKEKIVANKNKINATIYYTDEACTTKALGAITLDNFTDTAVYYTYEIKSVKYYKGENKVDFTRELYLDIGLSQRATGKVTEATFDPNNNTYYTKNIITVKPAETSYDNTLTYYTDKDCTTIATGVINALNFSALQYYVLQTPVVAVDAFDSKETYYADNNCTIMATGPVTQSSYQINTYYAQYAKQCTTSDAFVSNRTYYLDAACAIKATANWSSTPLNLYYIINQEFATNKDSFNDQLTYYTDSGRTTIVGTGLTSATFGAELPYYVKTGKTVNSDSRVKISTTSPYFLVQNKDGEKVIRVEDEQAKICGWTMADGVLHDGQVYLYASNQTEYKSIADSNKKNDWRIIGGSNFGVDSQGNLYARNGHFKGSIESSEGNIGGWAISSNKISCNNGGVYLQNDGTIHGAHIDGGYLTIGGNFRVDNNGNLTATNGAFNGKITSSEGNIGGWTITSEALSCNNGAVSLNSNGTIKGATIIGATIEADQSLKVGGSVLKWNTISAISNLTGTIHHSTLDSRDFVTDVKPIKNILGQVTDVECQWGNTKPAVFVNAVQLEATTVSFRVLGTGTITGTKSILLDDGDAKGG